MQLGGGGDSGGWRSHSLGLPKTRCFAIAYIKNILDCKLFKFGCRLFQGPSHERRTALPTVPLSELAIGIKCDKNSKINIWVEVCTHFACPLNGSSNGSYCSRFEAHYKNKYKSAIFPKKIFLSRLPPATQ